MKRYLNCLLLTMSQFAFAQMSPGFHPNEGYMLDDFSHSYADLNWVQPLEPVSLPYDSIVNYSYFDEFKGWIDADSCKHTSGQFFYTMAKDTVNKNAILTVTQPYGHYEPVKLIFKNEQYLDLSKGNAYVYLDIKNVSGSSFNFFIVLVDINGKEVDAIGTSPDNQTYIDWVRKGLGPGMRGQFYLDFNKHAYKALYKDSSCSYTLPAGKDSSFQMDKVAGLYLKFIGETPSPSYNPLPLVGEKIRLNTVRIGASLILGIEEEGEAAKIISIYPNPANKVLNFSSEMLEVKLMDALGNVVLTAQNAQSISVEHLNKGIYILMSSTLKATRVIVD